MWAELTCQVIREVMEGVSVFDYAYSNTVSKVAFYRVFKSASFVEGKTENLGTTWTCYCLGAQKTTELKMRIISKTNKIVFP